MRLILWIITNYHLEGNTENTGNTEYTENAYKYITMNFDHMTRFNDSFKKHKTLIRLYHGTKPNRLNSILLNGLLTLSKTKYMTSGNAYGDGIYLGDLNKAKTYSHAFTNDRPHTIKSLIGLRPILEVGLVNSKKYKHADIYVVSSETMKQSENILTYKLIFV